MEALGEGVAEAENAEGLVGRSLVSHKRLRVHSLNIRLESLADMAGCMNYQ